MFRRKILDFCWKFFDDEVLVEIFSLLEEHFCLFSGTFEEEAPGGVTRYFVLLSVFWDTLLFEQTKP